MFAVELLERLGLPTIYLWIGFVLVVVRIPDISSVNSMLTTSPLASSIPYIFCNLQPILSPIEKVSRATYSQILIHLVCQELVSHRTLAGLRVIMESSNQTNAGLEEDGLTHYLIFMRSMVSSHFHNHNVRFITHKPQVKLFE